MRREQGARGPGGLGQGVTPTQLPSGACVPSCCEQEEPTYFAIWGDNKAFNEVIISPAMLHEHLPYVVMEGLNKVRAPARPRAVTSPQRPAALCWAVSVPTLRARVQTLRGVNQSSCSGPHAPAVYFATWPRSGELRRFPGTCPRGGLSLEGLEATWHLTGAPPPTGTLSHHLTAES